jgi:hypothetical protein
VTQETLRFMDHEFARPRSDWIRAWRSWMRDTAKRFAFTLDRPPPIDEKAQADQAAARAIAEQQRKQREDDERFKARDMTKVRDAQERLRKVRETLPGPAPSPRRRNAE